MLSEDEIRKLGRFHQAQAILGEGSREEGQDLGAWWFAEKILGEEFPEMDFDEAEDLLSGE